MRTLRMIAASWLVLLPTSGWAEDLSLRYGNTSGWNYDNRDDHRDFPRNGVFPGNFARDPWEALTGAAGFLESNPQRSARPYPSQVVFLRCPPCQWPRYQIVVPGGGVRPLRRSPVYK